MRIEITMANLGYDMESGRIVNWLKGIGDRVARGEAIAEVETDKATVEMEALASGVLVGIVQPDGSEVPIGGVIGFLETDD